MKLNNSIGSTLLILIGLAASASFSHAQKRCSSTGTACPGFRTQTQGGWGNRPNGNNPGAYLRQNFAIAFPNGVTIGCENTLTLTSSSAVEAFLPSGSTARGLGAGSLTNPGNSYSNVLAGQLVALAISFGLDNAIPSFSSSSTAFKYLLINSGPFQGMTVGEFLAEANKKIGGCSALNYTFSQYNETATKINEAYVDGTTRTNFLSCPPACNLSADIVVTGALCYGQSNGSADLTLNGGSTPFTYVWNNGTSTQDLSGVAAGNYSVTVTDRFGCQASAQTTVSEPAELSASLTVTPGEICAGEGCDGSVAASVSGGTTDYQYAWTIDGSDAGTGSSVSGLCAGVSGSILVTDANGCTETASFDPLGCNFDPCATTGCTAADVISYWQGPRSDGNPVGGDRSDPNAMLGTPDGVNAAGGFYSLGFGGWVILKFDGAIHDGPGNDLKIFETTYNNQSCNQYPEFVRVAGSLDGVNFTDLGLVCMDGEVDIAPAGSCILYIKLTDATNRLAPQFARQIVDGYDVDGIRCLNNFANFGRASVSGDALLNPSISMFPNPAEGRMKLSLEGFASNETLQLSIVDHVGREVIRKGLTQANGSETFDISLEELSSGIFHVHIQGSQINFNQKLVKK